jgi:hypothetical protein
LKLTSSRTAAWLFRRRFKLILKRNGLSRDFSK